MKRQTTFFLVIAALFICQNAVAVSAQKSKPSETKTGKTSSKKSASPLQQTAVTVTQIDFEGLKNLIKPKSLEPRPLLVNFWATWCDPCREEFPELVKIDNEFRPRGLDFVTVSLDDPREIKTEVPKFLGQMKASMPAFLLKTPDEDAAISFVAPDWRGGLPMTVLFDASGKIAYSRMGIVKPEILRAEIEKILHNPKEVGDVPTN